jgi:D-glycero-D-manno-heptose 1,7-bisphosphate phosphatase
MMRPAVFLDRDGVINRAVVRAQKPSAPRSLEELEVLPGVGGAVNALRAAGYCLVVVTNQPDVARGTTPLAVVESINEKLRTALALDAVYMCVHDDRDGCSCRKPMPGLITRAAEELGLDLSASYLVGDRWRDIEAGRRARCNTFFLDHGYRERRPDSYDFRVVSLLDAARIILRRDMQPCPTSTICA